MNGYLRHDEQEKVQLVNITAAFLKEHQVVSGLKHYI